MSKKEFSMPVPRITVITPSFNQGRFIEQTILSVLGQEYPNLEYFIIDGGSTDQTVDIIKRYSGRVAWWTSEKDEGQAHAINKGFERATGDIVCWLNSDDLFMPGALNFIAAKFENFTEPRIITGNTLVFREGQKMHGWASDVARSHAETPLQLLDYIMQPSTFWTKSVIDKIGLLNSSLHFVFDWEWFIRAKNADVKLDAIPEILSLYRQHDLHKTGAGGNRRWAEIISIYEKYNTPKQLSVLHKLSAFQKSANPLIRQLVKRDRLLYRYFQNDVSLREYFAIKNVI